MIDESRRSLIVWVFIAVMAVLLFGNEAFRTWASKTFEERRLQRSLASLRVEHESLSRELALLQHEPAYTEYLIRKNLGYVKKGEVEYRLVKKPGH